MLNIYNIKIVFLLFIIYSFIGWVLEVLDQLYRQKKIINRGFFLGPYCPVHGIGALSMTALLSHLTTNTFKLFICGVIICSILEYFTGYILEKIFKARWWDYTDYKFNLNGRICLQNSLFFGIAGVVIIKFGNPFFIHLINMVPSNILNIIAIVLVLIFSIDLIITFNCVCSFKQLTTELTGDNTEEISNKVKQKIMKKSVLFKRLINAFPNLGRKVKKIKNSIVGLFYSKT